MTGGAGTDLGEATFDATDIGLRSLAIVEPLAAVGHTALRIQDPSAGDAPECSLPNLEPGRHCVDLRVGASKATLGPITSRTSTVTRGGGRR